MRNAQVGTEVPDGLASYYVSATFTTGFFNELTPGYLGAVFNSYGHSVPGSNTPSYPEIYRAFKTAIESCLLNDSVATSLSVAPGQTSMTITDARRTLFSNLAADSAEAYAFFQRISAKDVIDGLGTLFSSDAEGPYSLAAAAAARSSMEFFYANALPLLADATAIRDSQLYALLFCAARTTDGADALRQSVRDVLSSHLRDLPAFEGSAAAPAALEKYADWAGRGGEMSYQVGLAGASLLALNIPPIISTAGSDADKQQWDTAGQLLGGDPASVVLTSIAELILHGGEYRQYGGTEARGFLLNALIGAEDATLELIGPRLAAIKQENGHDSAPIPLHGVNPWGTFYLNTGVRLVLLDAAGIATNQDAAPVFLAVERPWVWRATNSAPEPKIDFNDPALIPLPVASGIGSAISVTGGGLAPNSGVSVAMHSTTSATLCHVLTDSDGRFVAIVRLPTGLSAGSHEVVASATSKDGKPVDLVKRLTLIVVSSDGRSVGDAPAASRSVVMPLLVGGGLLLLSAALTTLLVHRRRRVRPTPVSTSK